MTPILYALLCIGGAVSWVVLALLCYALFRSRWWAI
jgi:hypothetical protein